MNTLSRRVKGFQCIFSDFRAYGDRQKNVDPHFRGLDLGAQVKFLYGIFFSPLVQSEFYQEITKDWSEDQYPCTGALCRSYSPPSGSLFNNPVQIEISVPGTCMTVYNCHVCM